MRLTWKLVLILAFTFLYYYLTDLYQFESPLSQLGMLEGSFIATLLIGITVASFGKLSVRSAIV
ncbi:MAG TPA: hypothetical protein QF611_14395 [Pseudomonadales bacterium]|nr:hypothetical protein [Pseudomonadales bacterium]MDP6316879.1 hypothetical protein [Pseudomonadales bacterium]MDP7313826.1 hypothetical protein [Pseudomonadales bacterium]HJP52217.1 hypothetical protein [Pseudomonadales bacterium]